MLKGRIIINNPPILSSLTIEVLNSETKKGIVYHVRRGHIHPSVPPKFIYGKKYTVVVKRLRRTKSKQLIAKPGNCISIRIFLTTVNICIQNK